MNGWLVVGRARIDEIPMAFEKDEVKAIQFANLATEEDVIVQARKLGLDTSEVITIAIVEFKKGRPHGEYKTIQDFTE